MHFNNVNFACKLPVTKIKFSQIKALCGISNCLTDSYFPCLFHNTCTCTGDVSCDLHIDTGLTIDLIQLMADEKQVRVDIEGFKKAKALRQVR